jgi:hypothetical protein
VLPPQSADSEESVLPAGAAVEYDGNEPSRVQVVVPPDGEVDSTLRIELPPAQPRGGERIAVPPNRPPLRRKSFVVSEGGRKFDVPDALTLW